MFNGSTEGVRFDPIPAVFTISVSHWIIFKRVDDNEVGEEPNMLPAEKGISP